MNTQEMSGPSIKPCSAPDICGYGIGQIDANFRDKSEIWANVSFLFSVFK